MITLGWLLIAFFCIISVVNGIFFYGPLFIEARGGSLIPLIGGILGVFGIWLIDIPQIQLYFWAPVLIDAGCAPLVCWTLYRRFKKTDLNL